jgi:hypothetical protein
VVVERCLGATAEHEPADAHDPAGVTRICRFRKAVAVVVQAGRFSKGHARTAFRRALERQNLLVAEATAKEIGRSASPRPSS